MRRILHLLFLTATCCTASADESPNWGRVWLTPDQPGYEQQLQWGEPVPVGFNVETLPLEDFLLRCQQYQESCATVLGFTELATSTVVLRRGLETTTEYYTLLHEMGHILRGDAAHTPCESAGENIMCPWITTELSAPTDTDMAFVTHSALQN
jgi:hypothetical protein